MTSDTQKIKELKVGATSNVSTLSQSIGYVIKSGEGVRIIAAGQSAVNQANKAIARSRMFLAPSNINVLWNIYFTDIMGSESSEEGKAPEKISAIVLESVLQ